MEEIFMKRKIVALLLVLSMIASALIGCGGKKNTAEANFVVPEGGYDGSAVEIVFFTIGIMLAINCLVFLILRRVAYGSQHLELLPPALWSPQVSFRSPSRF